MRKALLALVAFATLGVGINAQAADYVIDIKGQHAFIEFRIKHLGYSWLYGRFNDFEGTFSYDEKNPSKAQVNVTLDTNSIDTNHAERDKHLRSDDFFAVDKYPQAKFVSTSFKDNGDGTAVLKGKLTLRGVTKALTVDVKHIGHGEDPWGGYRRGFIGTTDIVLKDFGIPFDLGPAARSAELTLSIEGVRQ